MVQNHLPYLRVDYPWFRVYYTYPPRSRGQSECRAASVLALRRPVGGERAAEGVGVHDGLLHDDLVERGEGRGREREEGRWRSQEGGGRRWRKEGREGEDREGGGMKGEGGVRREERGGWKEEDEGRRVGRRRGREEDGWRRGETEGGRIQGGGKGTDEGEWGR